MPAPLSFNLSLHPNLKDISADDWNALVSSYNPFMEYEFLRGLEESGSVGASTAWRPYYLTLHDQKLLIGAIPFYLKWDSYGEYIFDWAWAEAYARNGLNYYPKAVIAAPFTPANGDRILIHPDYSFEECAAMLVDKLLSFAEEQRLSSLHFLFLTQKEQDFLLPHGFLPRLGYQFHWENRGYQNFQDYLHSLTHKKRNQILKEREKVADLGLKIHCLEGESIQAKHLEAMWNFCSHTFLEKSGERPYLTQAFFEWTYKNFRHRTVIILAEDASGYIAGSINFKKGDHLFGRYWGASKYFPNLHFECCFYQLIEYAIQNKIQIFEAGAQGEQKFLRGFATRPTYSAHFISHSGFRPVIGQFLEKESSAVLETIKAYNAESPLKYLRNVP